MFFQKKNMSTLDQYFTQNDDIFKNIQFVETLGEGTYGEVTKCIGIIDGQKLQISLKMYKQPIKPESIIDEINILNELNHPNIIRLYEPIKFNGRYYLMCEFATNTLQDRIKYEQFTDFELRNYMKQILEGMKYLHSKHILHNDLKPANIYINEGKIVKIADFGLSRKGVTYEDQYVDKKCGGTMLYRAPETVAYGRANIGNLKQDIWSLACIFYEMSTGFRFINSTSSSGIQQLLMNFYGRSYFSQNLNKFVSSPDPKQTIFKNYLDNRLRYVRHSGLSQFLRKMFLNRPTCESLLNDPFWNINVQQIFRPLVTEKIPERKKKQELSGIIRPPMPFLI